MGINIFYNPTASDEIRIPVASAITAGDLLTNAEGVAVRTPAPLSMAQINNATAGLPVIYPVTSQGANYGDASLFTKRLCEVDASNVMEVYTGDGTTATTGVSLAIKSLLGARVSSVASVSTFAGCAAPRIKRLTASTVLIAWTESAALKFAIYNNDGTVAVAPATVATLASGAYNAWNVTVLAGGGVVFAYGKATSNNACMVRYNASGALQGAETVIESAAAPDGICVKELAAGGFVVYYYRSASTTAWKFARYDADGALQGALTTVASNATTAVTGEFDGLALELPNGNIVLQGSWDSLHNCAIYSAAGTLISTVPAALATQAFANSVQGLAVTPSGGFALLTVGSTASQIHLRAFDANGGAILPLKTVSITTAAAPTSAGVVALSLGASGFACFVHSEAPGVSLATSLAIISLAGVIVGSQLALQGVDAVARAGCSIIRHSSGLLVTGYKHNISTFLAVHNPHRTSLVGVALESVPAGALCRVAVKGTYTINQAMAQGGIFDQRAAVIPGNKGFILGASAVLLGLS